MGASIWRSSHSFVRSTIASSSQNNQRATCGQQREDVGRAPAEPSCCPYPSRVDRRPLGRCPSRVVASRLVGEVDQKYYFFRCEPTNARPPVARIKPMANGVSVTSRWPEVTCVASMSITGKTRNSKGSSAAQNAQRSPRRSGKMAMRTSTADKLPIASAPASKCLPDRVFMSGWVDRIEYAANPAKA